MGTGFFRLFWIWVVSCQQSITLCGQSLTWVEKTPRWSHVNVSSFLIPTTQRKCLASRVTVGGRCTHNKQSRLFKHDSSAVHFTLNMTTPFDHFDGTLVNTHEGWCHVSNSKVLYNSCLFLKKAQCAPHVSPVLTAHPLSNWLAYYTIYPSWDQRRNMAVFTKSPV